MSYAIPRTAEEKRERGIERSYDQHRKAKTRRGAVHQHNPAGTKLKKRIFQAMNERRPLRSELRDLVRCGKEFSPQPQQQKGEG